MTPRGFRPNPLPGAIFLALLLGASVPLLGQGGARVSSSVNKQSLRAGENLTFILRVEGTGAIPQPALPPLEGLRSAGQFQTVENTAGGRAFLFHYLLTPTRAGKITVPSIQVSVEGQARTVPGFSVEVETAPPRPVAPLAVPTRPLRADDFVLIGEVDPQKATVGQAVLYTLHLLAKPSVRRLTLTASPDFAGFQRVEDPGAATPQARQRRFKDGTYLDMTLKRFILFPLQPGELKVGDFQLTVAVEVGEYSPRLQEIPLVGGAIALPTKPLPPPPDGFLNCVGSFTFEADPAAAGPFFTGRPLTRVYRIRGEGFLPQDPVRWPETPLFQRYPPSVEDRSGFEGGRYRVDRTLTLAYIPKVAGPADLPPAQLVVFQPSDGKYKTLEAGKMSLTVAAAEGDVRGQESTLSPLVSLPRPTPPPARPMDTRRFILLMASPFAATACLWLGLLLWEAFLADPEKARRRRLRKLVAREMARARRHTDTRKHEIFHQHLHRALAGHLDLALGRGAEGLTRPQLRAALEETGCDARAARAVAELLEDLEGARYAPGQPMLKELQDRYDTAAKIVGRP